MKQAKFITVSLLVCIALILVVRAMYMVTGGSGLGPYLIAAFITGVYTLYTIYHLSTCKSKSIRLSILVYWVAILPFLTMWVWELF
jgi:hypothetical protein